MEWFSLFPFQRFSSYYENLTSKMLQNLKYFEHQHGATSGNIHTMKICYMHKIMENILYKITFRPCI
uniref:Uncharacterized protein n=1 Tax=Spermophilus dauricus TaxID=99837 RepID=A0A8C9NZF5_SPEDA